MSVSRLAVWRRMLLLSASFGGIIFAFQVVSTALKPAIIEHYGTIGIPWMRFATLLIAALLSWIVGQVSNFRTDSGRVILTAAAALGALMIWGAMLDDAGSHYGIVGMALGNSMLITLSTYIVWAKVTCLLRASDGIGFIVFGCLAQVATFAAGSLLGAIVSQRTLVVAAAIACPSFLLAIWMAMLTPWENVSVATSGGAEGKGIDHMGFCLSKVGILLGALFVTYGVLATLFQQTCYEQLVTNYHNESVGKFAQVAQLSGIIAFGFYLTVVLVIVRKNLWWAGLVFPSLVVVAWIGAEQSINPVWALSVFQGVEYAIFNTSRENLFCRLAFEVKSQIKVYFAVALTRLEVLVSGVFAIWYSAMSGHSRAVLLLALAAALASISIALRWAMSRVSPNYLADQ